jgi:glycosyltransferase involved in cell wall biosynthesis
MKVGVFVAFAGRNCGGPEVFERELVRAMSALTPQHEYHLYCLDRRAPAVIGLEDESVVYHLLRPSVRAVSMLTSVPRAIARTRPDVFHAPIVPPPFCPPDTVLNFSCSSLVYHPEFFPPLIRLRLRFLVHRNLPKVAKVICPSKHVRDVTHDEFKVPMERLHVIYPGISPLFRPIDLNETRAHLEEKHGILFPYFLFSGRWEPRKNLVRTLEAFALFKRNSRTEHRLVLTGGRSWGAADVDKVIRDLALEDTVVDLGKTPLDELPYLYGAADALVYASLWEGFGLPIVEAMACGTPVITSKVSAMPETAGDAALLVDPYSVDDMAEAMHQLATDGNLRQRLGALGLKRAQSFSWEKTARGTLDVYDQLAGEKSTSELLNVQP